MEIEVGERMQPKGLENEWAVQKESLAVKGYSNKLETMILVLKVAKG
jgi:hypothetical protein